MQDEFELMMLFGRLSDQWEDLPAHRADIEAAIKEAALEWLDLPPDGRAVEAYHERWAHWLIESWKRRPASDPDT